MKKQICESYLKKKQICEMEKQICESYLKKKQICEMENSAVRELMLL